MRDTEESEGFYLEPRSRKLYNAGWQPVVRVFRLIDGVVDEFYPLKDATGVRFLAKPMQTTTRSIKARPGQTITKPRQTP